jgi:hypothetical protein
LTWTGDLSWKLRRLAISAFLVFHVTATTIWVLPVCPIRNLCVPFLKYYILPLGMWQSWGMFAPDPIHDTVMLEAEVIDFNGVRYGFSFPRLTDYTWWQGIPRFRHSKYAASLSSDDLAVPRQFAAHHVLRRLKLPADVYPVSVHLFYKVRLTPPPGNPSAVDPMSPTKPLVIGTIRVETPREVNP